MQQVKRYLNKQYIQYINIKSVGYTVSILLLVWFILSFMDILANNTNNFNYATWNFFELFY